jgi:hypothetical protein
MSLDTRAKVAGRNMAERGEILCQADCVRFSFFAAAMAIRDSLFL